MHYFNDRKIEPFLKWAGGKRWLISSLDKLALPKFSRYIEPFLGSGAIFFNLLPGDALLSDLNGALIETYEALKSEWFSVFELLKWHNVNHSRDHYNHVRGAVYSCKYERAAQFIYLNRTCWNGLYRVNLKGQFNVPIGTKQKAILESDDFEKVSDVLQSAQLYSCDFEELINMAGDGDFVFIDPPYTVKHNNNNFIKYNEKLFSWKDQIRLRDAALRACQRGASILMTNADHQCVAELYQEEFDLTVLSRKSVIAADASKRGAYNELLIRRYKCE